MEATCVGGVLSEDTSWGSHLVPLMACVTATRGPVLEVGVGHWSTPLLHRYCMAGGRVLVSIDEDAEWVKQFRNLSIGHHTVNSAKYDTALPKLAENQWSVVFLDHSPGHRRAADALMFLNAAVYVVVHDFAEDVAAGFDQHTLSKWYDVRIAEFSPKTLVLGRTEIPAW